jgi:hypothetical protein
MKLRRKSTRNRSTGCFPALMQAPLPHHLRARQSPRERKKETKEKSKKSKKPGKPAKKTIKKDKEKKSKKDRFSHDCIDWALGCLTLGGGA